MSEHKTEVFKKYTDSIDYLNRKLGIDHSFDIVRVDLEYAQRKMALYLIDGFAKDDILHYLMNRLSLLEEDDLEPDPLTKLMKKHIPYIEIDESDDLDQVINFILSGAQALVVEGLEKVIIIDSRTYPARSPEEPDLERVVRGSRDGYVETIIFNTALTRRRVRDPSFRIEHMQIGRRSKTDICVCYIADIADTERVSKLKRILNSIDTDGLPMAEKTIEEFISGGYWNPYPTIRYTERPDTAAQHLFEGHVLIIIDGSPSVMISPSTFWQHMEHAEEYRQKPTIGAYLRTVRFIAIFASIFILPLYYLMSVQPELLPEQISFIGPNEPGKVPLLLQFLLAEIGIDVLRMAAIHTPTSLATALGLVAAIMIGQVSVDVGWFTYEVILYLAIAAIGTYATPSYELSLANRLVRIYLLLSTALFGPIGYIAGITLWILYLTQMKSFHIPYFSPFIPFSPRSFFKTVLRIPVPLQKYRMELLHPKDPDR